ncbi:MAG: benzoate-CoA ligase family protein [Pusillimonas sp.]
MSAVFKPLKGNVVDYLFEPSLNSPLKDRAFLLTPDGEVTFQALHERVCQVGNWLASIGVQPGDRVMFSVLDGVDFVSLFLGAMKIGAVSLPINTFLTAKDYGYYIQDSGASVVVIDEGLKPLIDEVAASQTLPSHVFVIGSPERHYQDFRSAVGKQPKFVATYPSNAKDTAFWLYSSGSTGSPKGVLHTHEHIHASTELFGTNTLGMCSDDVLLCPPKMFFAFGLGFQVYMSLRVCAQVIVDSRSARADRILENLVRYRPTLLVAVPTLFSSLLTLTQDLPEEKVREAFGRLRFCVSGGEVLAPSVMKGWQRLTGTNILDGVGTTEMTHMFVINRPGHVMPGSCGKVVDGYLVRLIDDNWCDVPVGQVGNMFAVGPSAATEYWNKPEKTLATMRDGGVLTGDKFYQDAEGNFYYVGRNDDMLRVGGIWVSPAEIESALAEHNDVSECAVIGVEDENALVKPKAYVVLRAGVAPSVQVEESIRQVVRDKLAHYKCPKWIEFVDDLPKTATGKIQRFRLRHMAQSPSMEQFAG